MDRQETTLARRIFGPVSGGFPDHSPRTKRGKRSNRYSHRRAECLCASVHSRFIPTWVVFCAALAIAHRRQRVPRSQFRKGHEFTYWAPLNFAADGTVFTVQTLSTDRDHPRQSETLALAWPLGLVVGAENHRIICDCLPAVGAAFHYSCGRYDRSTRSSEAVPLTRDVRDSHCAHIAWLAVSNARRPHAT